MNCMLLSVSPSNLNAWRRKKGKAMKKVIILDEEFEDSAKDTDKEEEDIEIEDNDSSTQSKKIDTLITTVLPQKTFGD